MPGVHWLSVIQEHSALNTHSWNDQHLYKIHHRHIIHNITVLHRWPHQPTRSYRLSIVTLHIFTNHRHIHALTSGRDRSSGRRHKGRGVWGNASPRKFFDFYRWKWCSLHIMTSTGLILTYEPKNNRKHAVIIRFSSNLVSDFTSTYYTLAFRLAGCFDD